MDKIHSVGFAAAGLILAKWAVQLGLEQLNLRHVLAHAGAVPAVYQGIVDEATYAKSVQYAFANGCQHQIQQFSF